MATARELLDQADALMRRNRGGSVDAEIPILTDAVPDVEAASGADSEADFPVLMDAVRLDDADLGASGQAAAERLKEAQGVRFHSDASSGEGTQRIARDGKGEPDSDGDALHAQPGEGLVGTSVADDRFELPMESPPASAGGADTPDDGVVLSRRDEPIDPVLDHATALHPGSFSSPAMSPRAMGSQATPPPRGSEGRSWDSPARTDRESESSENASWMLHGDHSSAMPLLDPEDPAPERHDPEAMSSDPSRQHDVESDHDVDVFDAHQTLDDDERSYRMHDEVVASERDAPASEAWPEHERSAPLPPANPALDDELHWKAVAEQISMQVLQRIDLFTDSGLKVQLAAHLKPIVDRAGAELVASINDQVGRLLRTYVAEAIEREIAQWRDDNR